MGWLSKRRADKHLGELIAQAISGGNFSSRCQPAQLAAWFAEGGETLDRDEASTTIRLDPKTLIRGPGAPEVTGVTIGGGSATLNFIDSGPNGTLFSISLDLDQPPGYVNTSSLGPCSTFIGKVHEVDPNCSILR